MNCYNDVILLINFLTAVYARLTWVTNVSMEKIFYNFLHL
jgi:hypothetical protein